MIGVPSDPRSKGGSGFGLAGAACGANDTKQATRSTSGRFSGQADFDTTGTEDCCAV